MENFGDVLEGLTRQLIADVLEAVRAELAAATAKRAMVAARAAKRATVAARAAKRADVAARAAKPRAVVRTVVRPSLRVASDAPVVVRSNFEIPVGRPRARRSSAPRRLRETRRPVAPVERPATFEVVPHPNRTNRRLVLTHLG
jgi:hypothetical protein